MKVSHIIVLLIISLIVFLCTKETEPYRYLGKLPVICLENVFFKAYQENAFDNPTALQFEIVDHHDSIILRRCHLIGTLDYNTDLRYFSAGSYDSIIYLAYGDSNEVNAIYDLKTNEGHPNCNRGYNNQTYPRANKLLKIIQVDNPELRADWNR